jgi:hypothetical protein
MSHCTQKLATSQVTTGFCAQIQEPIRRLLNLQLQRQRCIRLERFFKVDENHLVFQTRLARRGVETFYSAGVVTQDRRIGSLYLLLELQRQHFKILQHHE